MNTNKITKLDAKKVKENTIKVLSGACVVVICLAPVVEDEQYASEFHLGDSSTQVENVVEGAQFYGMDSSMNLEEGEVVVDGASFSFVPHQGSIGIRANK